MGPSTASESNRCQYEDRGYSTEVIYSDSDQTMTLGKTWKEKYEVSEERKSQASVGKNSA